mgnify:CR=1 FL=1
MRVRLTWLAGMALAASTLVLSQPALAQDAPAVAVAASGTAPLVLMTDFGTVDGAVSEVKGVAYGVSQKLLISDLSHQIDGIWDGAYRLYQVAPYWPGGTVFVAVIDPGVGTSRLSIAVRTRAGHYYIGPDNGLFTLIDEVEGIDEARVIDEKVNRLAGSEKSNTFHGRDVFGYTGARLASGTISWEQVGPKVDPARLVRLSYQHSALEGGVLKGMIPALDVAYGNVWTNAGRTSSQRRGSGSATRSRSSSSTRAGSSTASSRPSPARSATCRWASRWSISTACSAWPSR